VPRDPSLALGATKKGCSGRQKKGLGVLFFVIPRCVSAEGLLASLWATFPTVSSRGTPVPRDPSLALGATKKGCSGRHKKGLGVLFFCHSKVRKRRGTPRTPRGDKKVGSGRQQGSLHKLLKQTHVRLAHLFEFNNIIRNKWRRIGLKNFRVSNKNKG
jgi:hypothetical protein